MFQARGELCPYSSHFVALCSLLPHAFPCSSMGSLHIWSTVLLHMCSQGCCSHIFPHCSSFWNQLLCSTERLSCTLVVPGARRAPTCSHSWGNGCSKESEPNLSHSLWLWKSSLGKTGSRTGCRVCLIYKFMLSFSTANNQCILLLSWLSICIFKFKKWGSL